MTRRPLAALALAVAACAARADALDTLRDFERDVKTGAAAFTQVVTSPDGARKKTSGGRFEFERPNRFRFTYTKPFEQVIVGDGRRVWIYDADLNQVSSRRLDAALGATPAALLAGGSMDRDFVLRAEPDRDGLAWVKATPRAREGGIESLSIGFRDKALAALEIVDAFGQRSRLDFTDVVANASLPRESFVFKPPPGAEVIEQ